MHEEAAETEERCTEVAGELEGKKTAILEEARETQGKAAEMMKTYLDERGRRARRLRVPDHGRGRRGRPLVGAREAQRARRRRVHRELVEWALPIQQRHFQDVQLASTQLASEKSPQEVE